MFSPVEIQLWWGRNGAYVALFVTLTACFMSGDSAVNVCLLPISAVLSAWTVQRFVARRSPLAYWWSVSVVRWISWAILNLLASLMIIGFLAFTLLIFVGPPDSFLLCFGALLCTLLLMARHVYIDCRDVRRNFGTIAKGAAVLQRSERRRPVKGCRI